MNFVEKTGKTIDEAIALALNDLGVTKENVDIEVIEQPTKAILGLFGGKNARVKVTVKKVDAVEIGREFLNEIFKNMGVTVVIEKMTTSDGHVVLNIHGENLAILIGKHGQTLDALQYLTNLAANKDADERVKIVLDIEDYRKRRAQTLTSLALRLADKVKRRGEKVILEPMNSHERKIIHTTLQDNERVVTYSEGDEPYRKVVIALKK